MKHCFFCQKTIGSGEQSIVFNNKIAHDSCFADFCKKTGMTILKTVCSCGKEIFASAFVGINSAANIVLVAFCKYCNRKIAVCVDALEFAITH